MIRAVADTHTIIWYLSVNPKLSSVARQFIESTAKNNQQIAIASITLIEMIYLVEKGRIAPQEFSQLAQELGRTDQPLVLVSLTLEIARAMSAVDVLQIPDMPDRIIAATAKHLRVPLISRDNLIQQSNIQTIW